MSEQLRHEASPDPMIVISDGTAQVKRHTDAAQLFSNIDPILQDGSALGSSDTFYPDPFVTLFEDNSLQPLPQITDGFYADLSTVYGFMSTEYDATWTEYLPPRISTPGIFGDHFHAVSPPAQTVRGTNSSPQDLGSSQQAEIASAYAKLNEYVTTHQPTRPSSPSSAQAHKQFIQNLGYTSPYECDRLILDVFIGLFQLHVAPAFPCFKDFHADISTPEELYLAMAATGGLYCQLPRSEIVAKWLLHKARRKLLTLVHSQAPGDLAAYEIRIKQAYILMEIFSIVSGDKRILLLMEVFHAQTVQAFHPFIGDQSGISPVTTDKKLLAHAMRLLECYRVVLLQQPTIMYSTMILGDAELTGVEKGISSTSAPEDLSALLLAITSSGSPDVRIESTEQSTQSLCALSILASQFRRLPGSMARLQGPRGHTKFAPRDWRQEFVEVSLQRWLTLHSEPPAADTMLLYHLIHLSIYCHFAEVERTACTAKQMVEKNPKLTEILDQTSPTASSFHRWKADALQKCFTAIEDVDKAAWHASRIHEIGQGIKLFSNPSGETVHLRHEVDASTPGEPLHYSFAIYIASMVIWSSKFLKDDHREKESVTAADTALRKGVVLVSRSASQAARHFKRSLESLQEL